MTNPVRIVVGGRIMWACQCTSGLPIQMFAPTRRDAILQARRCEREFVAGVKRLRRSAERMVDVFRTFGEQAQQAAGAMKSLAEKQKETDDGDSQ